MNIDIDELLDKVQTGFNPKQRRVLSGRFGLKTGRHETLQGIGDALDITRERVRQIEEQSLNKLKPKVREHGADLLKLVETHLTEAGGLRLDSCFVNDIKNILKISGKVKHADQKLRFLLLAAGRPLYREATDELYAFWYSEENQLKKLLEFTKDITNFFKSSDKERILTAKIYLDRIPDFISGHAISILKNFGVNVFGDIGLKSWPEIQPKNIRDKAYLVLKKEGRPLHFQDVAKFINRLGIAKKRAHPQTVHNELIKDDRFVLVGRGLYGLKAHGFEPGTVKEVIVSILKKNGPLTASRVIELVSQKRFLKVNTILLNLQSRRHFRRLADGSYEVREV